MIPKPSPKASCRWIRFGKAAKYRFSSQGTFNFSDEFGSDVGVTRIFQYESILTFQGVFKFFSGRERP